MGEDEKNIDQAIEDLSWMLANEDDSKTYIIDKINKKQLDYSLDSLKVLDEYLEIIRKDKKILEKDLMIIILRVGAYLGETIKRNSSVEMHWQDYNSVLKINTNLSTFENNLLVSAILVGPDKELIFPLAKVHKYIENGKEDSLEFFAKSLCKS